MDKKLLEKILNDARAAWNGIYAPISSEILSEMLKKGLYDKTTPGNPDVSIALHRGERHLVVGYNSQKYLVVSDSYFKGLKLNERGTH